MVFIVVWLVLLCFVFWVFSLCVCVFWFFGVFFLVGFLIFSGFVVCLFCFVSERGLGGIFHFTSPFTM